MINIRLGMVRHNVLLLEKEPFVLELNFIGNTGIVVLLYCVTVTVSRALRHRGQYLLRVIWE